MTLFNRNGIERNPNSGPAGYRYVSTCGRCGGSGHYSFNPMDGTICFGCRGSGRGPVKIEKLYTSEKLAQMNATLAKRRAVKDAKAQAEREALERIRAKAREILVQDNAQVFAQLDALVAQEIDRQDGNVPFFTQLRRDILVRATMSDGQRGLIERRHAEMIERKAQDAKAATAGHLGAVGDKVKGVQARVTFAKFISADYHGQRWLVKLETEAGHQLTWWTNQGHDAHEDFRPYNMTVKAHEVYLGKPQTTVLRVACKAAVEVA